MVAVIATLVVIAVHLHTTPPGSRLSVRRIVAADIAVVNPATVAVAVRVDNVGTDPVAPTCLVQAEDARGRHHGSGVFSVRDPIEPGATTAFTARLEILGLGAQSVTVATAVCR